MRKSFHLQEAIREAWKLCWENNIKRRAEHGDFRGQTYYLTATDIELQVRQFAYESATGVEWGSTGRAYYPHLGNAVRISVPGNTLQGAVRDWLLHNPKIAYHNFKRGHISGARFRPVGESLSDHEKRTLEKKAKDDKTRQEKRAKGEPLYRVHFCEEGAHEPMCVLEQRRKKREAAKAKGLTYHGPMSRSHRRTSYTRTPENVTCPVCRNLLNPQA